jgi:hypothetical protein
MAPLGIQNSIRKEDKVKSGIASVRDLADKRRKALD